MGSDLKLYLGIVVAAYAIYQIVLLLFGSKKDREGLSWLDSSAPKKSSELIELSRSLTHQFTLRYAKKYKNPEYRKKLQQQLESSGMDESINVDEFIGMQILWGMMFPVFLCVVNFALQLEIEYVFLLVLAVPGFFLPRIHMNGERTQRVNAIRRDMPFFIDLLALSMEAGLDLQGAIKRIVDKSRGKSKLADALDRHFLATIQLGQPPQAALRKLAINLDMNEVASFCNVIIDATISGASPTKVIKEQAVQLRLERFVRAEKAGQQAASKILFPMIFLIMPAVMIVILGPIILQFMYGGGG